MPSGHDDLSGSQIEPFLSDLLDIHLQVCHQSIEGKSPCANDCLHLGDTARSVLAIHVELDSTQFACTIPTIVRRVPSEPKPRRFIHPLSVPILL